jgi:hypothetical protein
VLTANSGNLRSCSDRSLQRLQPLTQAIAAFQSQRLELAVVESEVLNQVLANNHGPGFGECQVFLGIALPCRGNHDDRKSELILRQELAAGIERLLILQFG